MYGVYLIKDATPPAGSIFTEMLLCSYEDEDIAREWASEEEAPQGYRIYVRKQ